MTLKQGDLMVAKNRFTTPSLNYVPVFPLEGKKAYAGWRSRGPFVMLDALPTKRFNEFMARVLSPEGVGYIYVTDIERLNVVWNT